MRLVGKDRIATSWVGYLIQNSARHFAGIRVPVALRVEGFTRISRACSERNKGQVGIFSVIIAPMVPRKREPSWRRHGVVAELISRQHNRSIAGFFLDRI